MAVVQTGDNKWAVAKTIVDQTAGLGSFTTITAACAAASSGDVIAIRANATPYTENFTLPAGITLTTMGGSGNTPGVSIVGTITMTAAGASTIYGCRLTTNGANSISITGSNAVILYINNCTLNFTNNTGINFTNSNAASALTIMGSNGDLGTTGIALFTHSSSGTLTFTNTGISNTGASSTANTCSAGICNMNFVGIANPTTFSGTAAGTLQQCIYDTNGLNVTPFTFGGSGGQISKWCRFSAGSAVGISMSQALTLEFVDVLSNNTNAINGSSTLSLGLITFSGSSSTINAGITQSSLVTRGGSLSLNTALTVPNGGTGQVTLTNHGVLIGAATTAITQLAAGSAGQVLQSGGASADPAYSTATFPTTATGTGTLLRADGTNWAATTTTYPNTNAVNTLLYASSANVMAALATANTAVLATNSSGVPSITATPTVTSITFGSGTALSNYAEGTWTPTMVGGSVAGSTTYSVQTGYYTRIGNLVTIQGSLTGSAATGTGNATWGGFPFTIKNQSNGNAVGSIYLNNNATWVFPAACTQVTFDGVLNTATAVLFCFGTATGGGVYQMANAAFADVLTLTHEI